VEVASGRRCYSCMQRRGAQGQYTGMSQGWSRNGGRATERLQARLGSDGFHTRRCFAPPDPAQRHASNREGEGEHGWGGVTTMQPMGRVKRPTRWMASWSMHARGCARGPVPRCGRLLGAVHGLFLGWTLYGRTWVHSGGAETLRTPEGHAFATWSRQHADARAHRTQRRRHQRLKLFQVPSFKHVKLPKMITK
jgi:hypothetical protein